ncbi:cyclic nucleotide-binding domain-containing protein 2-like [Anthonomus grandis grandis]|uniref:cyclic nucleotide-binding domain-containing protein 2-like n=1 Tax=Anthonomus grandis grandis TaxID=2921223 RepID=UPI0021656A73|nr:cyclic nucleotide-binding domain-containing protein 2-like [Anthonomus grandis grandis]
MSTRKRPPPGLSPEQKKARDNKARRRFKAYVRLVMANLFWLGDLDDSLGENVMLNIHKLTKKKIKKSTLTTKEKIILSKPKEDRTEEEKHLLNRAIGGLKVFRRYPPNVKSQLAAVTYFVYIGPDRVIVKQDHAPSAMYFLLSGEGVVTVRTYDKMLKEWIEEEHGTVGPGTMFGEVALIHGISRTATITTTMPCELLMIKKEDFNIVLKETVWKAWEESTRIINRYSYFKNWDTVTKRECSIISRTKTYCPDEVVLGDNIGLPAYSYLITKGTCSIIEHLQVMVTKKDGIKHHKLVIFEGETCVVVRNKKSQKGKCSSKGKGLSSILGLKTKSSQLGIQQSSSGKLNQYSNSVFEINESNIENHFMKVCELSEGAIFNIGETFERRRVVAQTNVNCLLIPRYWLIKMNKDNIWNRVQQYLNKNIPSTQKIYQEWLKEKKFVAYRKMLVQDILANKRVSNTNCIHNVPYSIRIKENAD